MLEKQSQGVLEVILLVFGQPVEQLAFPRQHRGNEIVDCRVAERGEFDVDGP